MSLKYAEVDLAGAVARTFTLAYQLKADEIKTRANGKAARPVTVVDPAFDPATQVRTGPVYTVTATKVTETFTVRAKTAAEINSEDAATVDSLPASLLLKIVFNYENRIRALEGKTAVTKAQVKTNLLALYRAP